MEKYIINLDMHLPYGSSIKDVRPEIGIRLGDLRVSQNPDKRKHWSTISTPRERKHRRPKSGSEV